MKIVLTLWVLSRNINHKLLDLLRGSLIQKFRVWEVSNLLLAIVWEQQGSNISNVAQSQIPWVGLHAFCKSLGLWNIATEASLWELVHSTFLTGHFNHTVNQIEVRITQVWSPHVHCFLLDDWVDMLSPMFEIRRLEIAAFIARFLTIGHNLVNWNRFKHLAKFKALWRWEEARRDGSAAAQKNKDLKWKMHVEGCLASRENTMFWIKKGRDEGLIQCSWRPQRWIVEVGTFNSFSSTLTPYLYL